MTGPSEVEILLVEDNPSDVELTLRALKARNLANQVFVARDGAEALEFFFGEQGHPLREIGVVPRVILLDLKLPKVDGLEVLRRLKSEERTRSLPVVVLTSSKEEADIALTDPSWPTCGARDGLRGGLLEAPDTPVILVTGTLDEEPAAEYIKAGAADYVVKHPLGRVGPAVVRALDLRRARTEQARAEEAPRHGEERVRALIEHGAHAVALVAPDGTLLFPRHSIDRLLGF